MQIPPSVSAYTITSAPRITHILTDASLEPSVRTALAELHQSPTVTTDETLPKAEGGAMLEQLTIVLGTPWTEQATRWNDRLYGAEIPFLLVAPQRDRVLIGPLVAPPTSPCVRCMHMQDALGSLAPSMRAIQQSEIANIAAALSLTMPLLQPDRLSGLIGRIMGMGYDGSVQDMAQVTRFAGCSGCRSRHPFPAEVYYATQLFPKSK
jgi:hypothetical protein